MIGTNIFTPDGYGEVISVDGENLTVSYEDGSQATWLLSDCVPTEEAQMTAKITMLKSAATRLSVINSDVRLSVIRPELKSLIRQTFLGSEVFKFDSDGKLKIVSSNIS